MIKIPFSTRPNAGKKRPADTLAALAARGVHFPDPGKVKRYLTKHLEIAAELPLLCKRLYEEFGPAAELSLEMYRDPECEDRHLILLVRLDSYDARIMDRINRVSSPMDDKLAAASGYLLVTTDFARPGKHHAV